MLDLGTVRPGTTLYIPFHTFDSNDPSASVTITGLAVTDIEIYRNGSVTQRASDAGYTLLDTDGIDFDALTGIHGFSIDLADNTTADFFTAGAQYWVVVSSITVDAATVSFIAATFRIGYPGALLDTTIATLASQTSFTLTAGSADNDAYNGWTAVIHDVASAIQVAAGYVSDYVGATKTVTLAADPAVFTMAAGDNISLFPPVQVASWNSVPLATTNPLPNAAADAAGGLPISDAGGLDLDTMDSNVSAILVDTGTTLDGKINTIDTNVDSILVDTAEIGAAGAGLTEAGGTGDQFTAIVWNAAWDAEVQSEVSDALVAINLDHLVANAVDTNFATTVHLDSVIGQLADPGTTATFDRTTDSLEAVRNHIGDGTNLTEAGGTGDHLTAINLPNQTMDITGNITGNLSGSVGSVTGAVGSVSGNVDGSVASVTAGVTLADNAIAAGKYDESTAFPLASAANRAALTEVKVTCTTGGSTTSVVASAVTDSADTAVSAVNDQFKGRALIFASDTTTANLRGQATTITAYTHATLTFTVDAMTTAPAAGDTAVIV